MWRSVRVEAKNSLNHCRYSMRFIYAYRSDKRGTVLTYFGEGTCCRRRSWKLCALRTDSLRAIHPRSLSVATPAGESAETTAAPKTSGAQTNPQSAEAFSVDSSQGASDTDTTHEASNASDSFSLSFGGGSQDGSGLSDLPSMGSFMDDDFDENVDDSVQTNSSGFSMTGIQTGGTDSKVMAQAIRTVLATED